MAQDWSLGVSPPTDDARGRAGATRAAGRGGGVARSDPRPPSRGLAAPAPPAAQTRPGKDFVLAGLSRRLGWLISSDQAASDGKARPRPDTVGAGHRNPAVLSGSRCGLWIAGRWSPFARINRGQAPAGTRLRA
jgi:hypothetical protein